MDSTGQYLLGPPMGQFAQTSHGTTYYIHRIRPESKGLVVLLHGLGTTLHDWDFMCARLQTSNYSTLRYDLYGCGYSKLNDPLKDLSLQVYDTQLRDLLSSLNLWNTPFTLIGWSIGATVSIHIAQEHPNLVQRLILLSPTLDAALFRSGFLSRFKFYRRARIRNTENVKSRYLGWLVRRFQQQGCEFDGVFYPNANGSAASWASALNQAAVLCDKSAQFPSSIISSDLNLLNQSSLHALVKRWGKMSPTLPVLIVWGNSDKISPASKGTLLPVTKKHSSSQVVTIEGGEHALVLELPERTASEVCSWDGWHYAADAAVGTLSSSSS